MSQCRRVVRTGGVRDESGAIVRVRKIQEITAVITYAARHFLKSDCDGDWIGIVVVIESDRRIDRCLDGGRLRVTGYGSVESGNNVERAHPAGNCLDLQVAAYHA